MTAETTEIVVNDDLDAFSNDFYGITPEEVKDEPEVKDDPAPEADKPEGEDTPEADDVDPVDEPEKPEESDKDKPKGKKTAQERISELTAARREAERRAEELERKLSELQKDTPKPKETIESKAKEPSPDDVGEDGEPKYALGEFDPQYIRDLTKFTLQQEKAAADAVRAEEDRARQERSVRDELINKWEGKIQSLEEELPDFRTKAATLEDTFSGIEPRFGEYLATTIMSMDAGPQVIYYLAENLDEAEAIVGMGPVMAAVALGRIEASLVKPKSTPAPKTSDAPPPPPRNRGGNVRMTVPGDTEDLDAFEKEFFKKK